MRNDLSLRCTRDVLTQWAYGRHSPSGTGGTWGIINSVKGDQYAVMVKAIAHNFQWFDVLRQVALLCSTYSARMQLAKFIRQRTQGD